MIYTKITDGVMVMKDGKAWGVEYEDHNATAYGWVHPLKAFIRNPEICTNQTDFDMRRGSYTNELKTGKLVKIKETIILEILE